MGLLVGTTTITGMHRGTTDVLKVFQGNKIVLDLSAPAFSPEVQLVLDRMTVLSQTEIDSIETFVDGQVLIGNWSLIDEFYMYSLNQTDSLTGFKSLSSTLIGSPVHSVAKGYTKSTTNVSIDVVDTGVDYSIMPQTSINNAITGIYLSDITYTGTGNHDLFRAEQNVTVLTTTGIRYRGSDTTDYRARMHGNSNVNHTSVLLGNNIYSMRKQGTNVVNMLIGSTQVGTTPSTSTGVPSGITAYALGGNTGGTVTNARQSSVSMFYTGAGVGFDSVDWLRGVRQFLIDLGVTGIPAP